MLVRFVACDYNDLLIYKRIHAQKFLHVLRGWQWLDGVLAE